MNIKEKFFEKLSEKIVNVWTRMRVREFRAKLKSVGEDVYLEMPLAVVNGENITVGDHSRILKNARLQCNISEDRTSYISIGNYTGINYHVTILAGVGTSVIIGDHVAIASNVFISSGGHEIDPISELDYGSQPYTGQSIEIKEGSWIGEKACILSGVTIGEKSIIGAGAVVTKDVPDYSIAVGNPARVVKHFDFVQNRWVKNE